jgi:hypothetical protein
MQKNTKKEKEITKEEKQKNIDETKEEAHETVKSKKSKYKKEENFVHRVGESIVQGYDLIDKKIKKGFEKIKANGKKLEKKEEPQKETKQKKK